jgi:voltage-gated potassium channel
MRLADLRKRLHDALDPAPRPEGGLSRLNAAIVGAIVVSVAITVVETEVSFKTPVAMPLFWAQTALGVFFVVEYLARVWTAVERPEFERPFVGRLRYALTPAALIDLLALTPMFIVALFALGLGEPFGDEAYLLRLARVLRILRVVRLGRFSHATVTLATAVASRRYELVATLVVAVLLLLVSSTLLYFVEGHVQPEEFGSIPRAMWWSVATLTTVGYGDVTPVTPLGRVFAGVTAVIGIGLIAMPTGILAAALSNALEAEREAEAARRAARDRARRRGRFEPSRDGD